MEGKENGQETAEIKAWLSELLKASGQSKTALAREIKVESRTIYNAFSGTASLPRGLTFYRLLLELGALKPDAPGSQETIGARLGSLEAEVAAGFAAVESAIEQLAARLPRGGQSEDTGR